MSDLIDQLRKASGVGQWTRTMLTAADRIAELEKLNALLNKQLSEANATLAAVRLTLGKKK